MAILVAHVPVPIGRKNRIEVVAGLHRVRRVQLFDLHTSRARGASIYRYVYLHILVTRISFPTYAGLENRILQN